MEEKKQINFEEKEMNPSSGWGMLFLSLILYLASIGAFIAGGKAVSDGDDGFAAVIFILDFRFTNHTDNDKLSHD